MKGLEGVFAVFTMIWLMYGAFKLFRFLGLFLSNKKYEKDSKITTAYVSDIYEYYGNDYETGRPDYLNKRSIISVLYFDEYIGKEISRELSCNLIRSSLQQKDGRVPTKPFNVQYTRNSVRLYDEQYVKISDYAGKRHGILTLISAFAAFTNFILFVVYL